MTQGKKTSIIASAAIFILLEIAALAMLERSSTLQNIWINRASHRAMAALWGTGERIRNFFLLETINESLVKQNDSLARELESFRNRQKAIDEAMATALPSGNGDGHPGSGINPERARFSYTPATIVKMSRNRPQNYVIINKGYEDGIRPQSGIITGKGVIGVITSVSDHYAYGLTLMNPNVTISTKVGPEGITAPLVWDGINPDRAVVTDIPPHCVINQGDTVRTSGYSSIFPEGIAIGVTGESRLVDGSNQHVDVRLFQTFNSAHYVTVTRNMDLEEIQALEAGHESREDKR